MFRRYKKCYCMNNNLLNYNNNSDEENEMIEKQCEQNCSCDKNNYNDNCSCGFDEEDSVFPENPSLGQSYVPIQYMDKTFKPCIGLKMGTIFPELVSPYRPGQSMEEIKYIANQNIVGEGCNR